MTLICALKNKPDLNQFKQSEYVLCLTNSGRYIGWYDGKKKKWHLVFTIEEYPECQLSDEVVSFAYITNKSVEKVYYKFKYIRKKLQN